MKQVVPEIYVLECKQALEFYRDVFGGTIKNVIMSGDLPLFAHYEDMVIHSELHVGSSCIFYFVDIFEENRSQLGNVTLVLHMDSLEELQQCFSRLSEGGDVGMAVQKTNPGEYHAIVTDRFGAPWALHFAP